ncbi:hypothetical protein V3481_001981 [Fusarium oxysporum f. sp. vasinfectum]
MFQPSVAVYFLSHNSPSVFIFLQLVNTDHALPRPTSSDASFGLSRMPETTTFLVDSHTVSKNKKRAQTTVTCHDPSCPIPGKTCSSRTRGCWMSDCDTRYDWLGL